MSFLKAKAKPLKPRAPKTTFELKTTLQSFKRRKVEEDQKIAFVLDPNFNFGQNVEANFKQSDQQMAPAPMTDDQKKKV